MPDELPVSLFVKLGYTPKSANPSHRHSEQSRPTLSSTPRDAESPGWRSEESLFDRTGKPRRIELGLRSHLKSQPT
jgi:hypothetical protein